MTASDEPVSITLSWQIDMNDHGPIRFGKGVVLVGGKARPEIDCFQTTVCEFRYRAAAWKAIGDGVAIRRHSPAQNKVYVDYGTGQPAPVEVGDAFSIPASSSANARRVRVTCVAMEVASSSSRGADLNISVKPNGEAFFLLGGTHVGTLTGALPLKWDEIARKEKNVEENPDRWLQAAFVVLGNGTVTGNTITHKFADGFRTKQNGPDGANKWALEKLVALFRADSGTTPPSVFRPTGREVRLDFAHNHTSLTIERVSLQELEVQVAGENVTLKFGGRSSAPFRLRPLAMQLAAAAPDQTNFTLPVTSKFGVADFGVVAVKSPLDDGLAELGILRHWREKLLVIKSNDNIVVDFTQLTKKLNLVVQRS